MCLRGDNVEVLGVSVTAESRSPELAGLEVDISVIDDHCRLISLRTRVCVVPSSIRAGDSAASILPAFEGVVVIDGWLILKSAIWLQL